VGLPAAVFFDVDFTLIYPGPRFQGIGYHASCARHGVTVDPAAFRAAVAGAASLLDTDDPAYDAQVFIDYTRRIIELMGGRGPGVGLAAREIYEDWAANHHFELYDDVAGTLARLHARGLRLGLISNTHRSLDAFQSHFALDGFIGAAVSSSEHGYMKPHPSIFTTALQQLDTPPAEALMVGDSVGQDIDGALRIGMRAVLVHRGDGPHPRETELASRGVPVIRSLHELPLLSSDF
jgi:HAD superfamily hydrolase (TIGR01662 family)